MRHGFGYMGRFERNFDTFGPGVRTYVRADGSLREVDEKPGDFDGIWFGFMERTGKSFWAVRVQYRAMDIFLKDPVLIDCPRHSDGKSFGPQTTTCGDASAKRLLADLTTVNPDQADQLVRVAQELGWDLDTATRKHFVNHEQRAANAWDVLVARAAASRTITYADLAANIGIHHRALSQPLGLIQDYCLDRYPPLTSIVVHSHDRLPGEGFIAWDVDNLGDGQRRVYQFDWSGVANPFKYAASGETVERLAHRLVSDPGSSGPIYQLVKARGPAQTIFRLALLEAYNWACAFCGLTFVEALDAAHIYPWSKSSLSQRINVTNGLLLCSNHHRLFDHEWITITDEYKIVYKDINLEDAPYTDIDKVLGPSLHGAKLRLPIRKDLWPSPELIRMRYNDC